jgi:hypothetical protein
MSTLSSNGKWQPRKVESLTCPSGQVVQVRRPGPEFTFRAGRIARTFSKVHSPTEVAIASSDNPLSVIENMSDEELSNLMVFGRDLICATVVSPKIVLHPREGFDEIGPDDIGNDFWFLFNYVLAGFTGIKVPVGGEEVEIKDLETFREESGVSGHSMDSEDVRTETEHAS